MQKSYITKIPKLNQKPSLEISYKSAKHNLREPKNKIINYVEGAKSTLYLVGPH